MKKQIIFEIECGEKTCASEPGQFCKWFGTTHYGQAPYCFLFDETLPNSKDDGTGWALRCKDCIKQETK